jgi:hypothetical protein
VLIRGVLDHLFEMGVCVVTTSNRAPEELDRSRLQEKDFAKFLKTLDTRCAQVRSGAWIATPHQTAGRPPLNRHEFSGNAFISTGAAGGRDRLPGAPRARGPRARAAGVRRTPPLA